MKTLEEYSCLSIYDMTKSGFFNDLNPKLSFSVNRSVRDRNVASVFLCLVTQYNEIKLNGILRYKIKDDREENWNYTISLTSTNCNYGGKRWWFICPFTRKRCAKMYLHSTGIFLSRKALGNPAYEVQNDSKKQRRRRKGLKRSNAYDEIRHTIKYTHRNGIPTKKYQKYLDIEGDEDGKLAYRELNSIL